MTALFVKGKGMMIAGRQRTMILVHSHLNANPRFYRHAIAVSGVAPGQDDLTELGNLAKHPAANIVKTLGCVRSPRDASICAWATGIEVAEYLRLGAAALGGHQGQCQVTTGIQGLRWRHAATVWKL